MQSYDATCPYCLETNCVYAMNKDQYFDAVYSGELLFFFDGAVPYPVANFVMRHASYRYWFGLIVDKDLTKFRSKRDLPRCVIDMVQGHYPSDDDWFEVGFVEEVSFKEPPEGEEDLYW